MVADFQGFLTGDHEINDDRRLFDRVSVVFANRLTRWLTFVEFGIDVFKIEVDMQLTIFTKSTDLSWIESNSKSES